MNISFCKVRFVTSLDIVIFSPHHLNEAKENINTIIKKLLKTEYLAMSRT